MATRIPIPAIQRQQRLPVGLPGARVPMAAVEDNRGRALAAMGGVLGGMVQGLQREELVKADKLRKEEDVAWLSKASSDDQLKWLHTFTERQNTAAAGAPDFTPQFLGDFDRYADDAANNAPERVRAAYRESLARLRTNLGGQALRFEADRRRDHLVSQYTQAAQADATSIALNPALYDERRVFLLAGIEASELPADVKTKILSGSEAALAMAAGSTLATAQPRQTLAAMRASAEGKQPGSGYGWVNHLDANQILQLRSRAQAEIDRRENKALIATATRERQAAGALSAYAAQLQMGVPPRPEDLNKWTSLINGSVHQATFDRLQQGWGEVQSVFAKPVADKVAAVQAMQQKLQTEGGNPQDVMLLELTQKGLAANVQMQTADPLQWLAQFADTPIEPLDLSGLGTPEGTASIQTILTQREHAIAALREQNPGVDIAPALLQPQEAMQIVGAFTASNANEQVSLLQSLVQAAGTQSPKRLENMLVQLQQTGMPDADDMVRVAAIAGREARIPLTNNTFRADTVYTNRQVAGIALHGREILQANGKIKDGPHYKPPKDSEIMTKIQAEIAKAYSSPVPGDSGYVDMLRDAGIVKYMYVGEAARKGKLAETLDDNLLKQSVRATLGQKVDYHGSTVFAPLGMNEDRFVQHADFAIEQVLKEQNLWTKDSDVSEFGLRAVGPDKYMVTLGDAPVGVSIQIDANDADFEARAHEHKKNEEDRRVQERASVLISHPPGLGF